MTAVAAPDLTEQAGALMRPATLRAYAADAGFADVQVAPVKHDLMRFYVLTP